MALSCSLRLYATHSSKRATRSRRALDWLNVFVLLRAYNYNGPFNLDYKPPRTTSNSGVFPMSFPTAVDRFITLWEMAGEVISDPVTSEATAALKAGGGKVDTPKPSSKPIAKC
jgi:hypothetical protein